MKKDQKLIDLFKNNEHKLHEYPSTDAWNRLEKRLDAHRKRRRISINRPIAMAAALVLLVGMVALFTWVSDTFQQENKANAHFVLLELEDLPPSEGSNVYAQNLAIRERYDQSELNEGDSQKRFRVNQPRQAPADARPTLEEPSPGGLVAESSKLREDPPKVDYSPIHIEEEKSEIAERVEMDAPSESEVAVEFSEADEIAAPPAEYQDAAQRGPVAKSKSIAPQNPFEWLVGTWESEDQDPTVFEEWSYLNNQQLKGVTYTLSNNQKEVLEEVEINQVNGIWNYNSPQEGAFQLQSQESNQAVFSNAMPNQANQLILQRNGDEEFSTILQYEMDSDTLLRKSNNEVRRMRRSN